MARPPESDAGQGARTVMMPNAEVLFALHRQGVFRYLSRVVGRAETAQDLTQEVFLRVTRAEVPQADASGHRAWVFKIARNLVLNHLRDGHRRGQPVELVDAYASAPATQELAVAIREALASARGCGSRRVPPSRVRRLELRGNRRGMRSHGRGRAREIATGARATARRARFGNDGRATRLCQHPRRMERSGRRPMTDSLDVIYCRVRGRRTRCGLGLERRARTRRRARVPDRRIGAAWTRDGCEAADGSRVLGDERPADDGRHCALQPRPH